MSNLYVKTLLKKKYTPTVAALSSLLIGTGAVKNITQEDEKVKIKNHFINDDTTTCPSPKKSKHLGNSVSLVDSFPRLSLLSSTTYCAPPTKITKLRRFKTSVLMTKTANKQQSIKDVYHISRNDVLGEGAFGQVFLATHKKSGEKVALKVIPKKFTSNECFQREMNALIKIRRESEFGHPNICSLHEHFEEDRFYYLIFDLVSGGEMFDHLIRIGAYSEADAARLVREVTSALAFMHGIGVVHGDLKPENLMLSTERVGDAVIKVVDFGCAHVVSEEDIPESKKRRDTIKDLTSSSSPWNRPLTPAYCPPECFEQDPASKNSKLIHPSMDMWGLGVIIYIMLTGLHPFDLTGQASDDEILEKLRKREKPPLRNSPITAHLSESAINLIEKLIEWEPDKRLTAFEMLQDPWVRGETARTNKIADSDKKLSMFREFRTHLEAKVFQDLVTNSDEVSHKTSLIEQSFRSFDKGKKGFLTTKDLLNYKNKNAGNDNAGSSDGRNQMDYSTFSNLLSENMKNKYFQKGEILYREGDIGNHMYFINSGTIEVTTKDGTRTLRHRGDCFGEGALLHPKKIRSATIRCVTPVHAIEISREYFDKYMKNSSSDNASSTGSSAFVYLKEKDNSRKRNRAKTILRLQQNLKEVDFRNGEYLFQPGEVGDALYILEEGYVEVQVDNLKVFHLEPGDFCGEHSLIMKRSRNSLAQCLSKDGCKLHKMRSKDFYELMSASSKTIQGSMRDMCLRREFQKAIVKKTKQSFPSFIDRGGLREVFDAVDKDKSGAITLDDLKDVLVGFDVSLTQSEIEDVIQSLDLDGSGVISFDEFIKIFGVEKGNANM